MLPGQHVAMADGHPAPADPVLRLLLVGLRFPVQERVEAGVSYREMLAEFGWGSAYIVSFLFIMGVSQVLTVAQHSAHRSEARAVDRTCSGCRCSPFSSARSAGRCSCS